MNVLAEKRAAAKIEYRNEHFQDSTDFSTLQDEKKTCGERNV